MLPKIFQMGLSSFVFQKKKRKENCRTEFLFILNEESRKKATILNKKSIFAKIEKMLAKSKKAIIIRINTIAYIISLY